MRLWVTRTLPDAVATAERLGALGHEPVVAPVLVVERLNAPVSLDGVGALAFTSRNALAAVPKGLVERDFRVFTVGRATAEEARAAGFSDVLSADGDGAALAELIAAHAEELQGEVLHLGAEELAFDLAEALAEQGVRARRLPVYRTRLAAPAELASVFDPAAPPLDGLLVHSPRAARRAAGVLAEVPGRSRLTAYAISEAAAAPLRSIGLRAVHVADAPNEESLISLVEHGPPPPLFSPLFWALIGFGVLAVAAGAAVAFIGPRL